MNWKILDKIIFPESRKTLSEPLVGGVITQSQADITGGGKDIPIGPGIVQDGFGKGMLGKGKIKIDTKLMPIKEPKNPHIVKMPIKIVLNGELRYHKKWKKPNVRCGFTNAIQIWNEGFITWGQGEYVGDIPPDKLEPVIYYEVEYLHGLNDEYAKTAHGHFGSFELEASRTIDPGIPDCYAEKVYINLFPTAKNAGAITARIESGNNDPLSNGSHEDVISKKVNWVPRFYLLVREGKEGSKLHNYFYPHSREIHVTAVVYWGVPWGSGDVAVLGDILKWIEKIPIIGTLESWLGALGSWIADLF
jgi:hypothetical protein